MEDLVKATGHIDIVLKDEFGNVKDTREIKNIVVTAGKNYLAAWLAAASQAGKFMSYMGVGTGSTPAASTDTALQTPLATYVQGTLTSSGNVWQNVCIFGAGVDTGAITEAGLFDAASPTTMFAHQVFSVVNKGVSDSIQFTWQVTFS